MLDRPLVSVIIPTYNSSSTLEFCLLSLRAQTYKNIEIVVVDNYSSDDTARIVKEFGANLFLFKSNLPSARNRGLSLTNGKYVLHLDSDMCLTSRVTEECVKKCEEHNFEAVSIPEQSGGESFWAKCISLEKFLYSDDEEIITPRFFKKTVLEDIGASDENLEAGEDWDLWIRLKERGYKVSFINAYLVHHESPLLTTYIKKKYRWTKTVYRYLSKHPSTALRQWTPLKPRHLWRNRGKILKPQYFFGMLFLKFLKLFLGLVGLLVRE